MTRLLLYIVGLGLVVHGLIHLMGFVAYWPLGTIEELPYKTALLDGRWAIGATGMRVYSLFWLLAMLGFILSAAGLLLGWSWWQPLLVATVVLSLLITVLDWSVAFRGAAIDVVILVGLFLLPRFIHWLPSATS